MKLLLTVLIFLSTVFHAHADWEQCSGPYRGEVTNIIEHNGYLFAITSSFDCIECPVLSGETYLIRSGDRGLTWSKVKNLPSYTGSSLLYNSLLVFNDVLYLLNDPFSSWRSTDNGETWNILDRNSFLLNLRFQARFEILNVYDIIELNGRYICLTSEGVFISDDNGIEWKKKYNLSNNSFQNWLVPLTGKLYQCDSRLYFTTNEGLYCSKDNGNLWEKDSVTSESVYSFYYHDGVMYLGVEDGMYRSDNKGETWEFIWINNFVISSFATRNDTLYCATKPLPYTRISQGVLYSTDQGKTWHSNSVFRKLSDSRSFYFNDSIMLVGTFDNGIYRSSDGGKNWLQTGYIQHRISALASINEQLIVGIKRYTTLFPHNFTHRIYKSSRNRKYWELNDFQNCTFFPGKTSKINSLFVKDSVIFAMFDGPATNCLDNTLLISRNFGLTWELQKKMNVVNDSYILFQEPYNKKDTLFLTTFNAIFNSFFSTDNGASWHNLSRKLTFYDNYVVGKIGNYYSLNYSLYMSTDQGITWSEINVDQCKQYHCLYENDGTVYVSTDKGIYSTYDGINWQSYGLSTIKVSALTVVDNFLYAGTDQGLFKRELLISSLEEQSSKSSIHIYPNPTNEKVNIEGASPGSLVSIYGVTGDRVLEIEASSGTIDISTLSAGYYTVIIQGQTSRTHRSLCIVR